MQVEPAATFVGAQACAGCHAAETEKWRGSHHAAAMQAATPATVLGDFADARNAGKPRTGLSDADRMGLIAWLNATDTGK